MLSNNCNINVNDNAEFGSQCLLIRCEMGECELDLSGLGLL